MRFPRIIIFLTIQTYQFDELEQPTSPKTWNSIAEAEAELDHHFEKKKQMGFSGFVSAFKGSTKSEKSQRKQGRSSSVPNRRATAPVGSIGELANKPRTPDAKVSARTRNATSIKKLPVQFVASLPARFACRSSH